MIADKILDQEIIVKEKRFLHIFTNSFLLYLLSF